MSADYLTVIFHPTRILDQSGQAQRAHKPRQWPPDAFVHHQDSSVQRPNVCQRWSVPNVCQRGSSVLVLLVFVDHVGCCLEENPTEGKQSNRWSAQAARVKSLLRFLFDIAILASCQWQWPKKILLRSLRTSYPWTRGFGRNRKVIYGGFYLECNIKFGMVPRFRQTSNMIGWIRWGRLKAISGNPSAKRIKKL